MRRACKKIWIFLCIFSFVGVPGVARADDYKERTLQELARLLKNLLEETEKKGPSKKNPSPSDHKLAVESATPAAEQVKYEAAIEKHASNAHLDSKNPNFKKSALALLEAAEERLNARGYRLGPIQVDPEGRAGLGFEILTTGKDPLGKVLEKSQKRFGHRLFIGIFGQILGTYEVKKKVMTLHPIAFSHPSGATSMIALHEIRHAYLASKAEAGKPTPLSTFAYAMGDMPVSNLPGYEKFLSFEEISTNFRTLKQLSETPVSKAELLGLTQLEKIYQTGKDIYTIADDIKKINELGLQVLADSESKLTFLPRNFNSPYLAIQLPAAQGKTSPGILVLSLDRKFADATLSSVRAAAMDSLRASLAEA